jgi:hypothetical protein
MRLKSKNRGKSRLLTAPKRHSTAAIWQRRGLQIASAP